MFSPYLVKRNISQFVHIRCFKSHERYNETLQQYALKQSCHWSMKLCWLWPRINRMLLQLTDVPHWFLINMFLCVDFNQCFQVLVHSCGFLAAGGESEWCILLWCLAAQTVAARHLSSCLRVFVFQLITRAQKHWDAATQDSKLHTRGGLPTDQTSVL